MRRIASCHTRRPAFTLTGYTIAAHIYEIDQRNAFFSPCLAMQALRIARRYGAVGGWVRAITTANLLLAAHAIHAEAL